MSKEQDVLAAQSRIEKLEEAACLLDEAARDLRSIVHRGPDTIENGFHKVLWRVCRALDQTISPYLIAAAQQRHRAVGVGFEGAGSLVPPDLRCTETVGKPG
jgi:hypothetical protein